MRYLVGFVAFVAVWLLGAAVGIRPSIAEGLLVVFSVGAMEISETLYSRRAGRHVRRLS